MAEAAGAQPQHAVRFSSHLQEITPEASDDRIELENKLKDRQKSEDLTEEQAKELRDLSISLRQSHVQSSRMHHFVFDPVSLPPSRVPSGGSSTPVQTTTGLTTRSSPMSRSNSQTPLTPADSGSKDDKSAKTPPLPTTVTPQISPHQEASTSRATSRETRPSAAAEARKLSRPKSLTELSGTVPAHPKLPPAAIVLPQGDSFPPSQDNSPLGTPREQQNSGQQSPYSRPFTPVGDPNDPYARARRPPQARNLEGIDPRFVFGTGKERPKTTFFAGGVSSSPRNSILDLPKAEEKKPASSVRKHSDDSTKKHHHHHATHHGSMSDLKRFFKFGSSKKDKEKRDKSPAPSIRSVKPSKRSGTATPTRTLSSSGPLPFADDHGLEAKYGKFEKILGSGAGGSVRLMKRADGVTFAVKQFRERHAWETEKAYNKKITAEFCIGSTLHHGNIIEAMDIVHEKGRWYEVMEYAPYDLFAIVMTGRMSREEVACCFMQILNGVAYLHGMGLAHRDMKLDNVVVNEHGIMKIIDFGSAHVFQYPFEGGTVLAEGVVGSDPYLAPEVFTQKQYDAQKVDIWSLAIIFCCMSLRRFPWKCPKSTDNSFKLFITQPTEEELKHPLYPQRPQSPDPNASRPHTGSTDGSHHHHHSSTHSRHVSTDNSSHQQTPSSTKPSEKADDGSSSASTNAPSTATTSDATSTTSSQQPSKDQQIVLKGAWRLLRLLPRETRHIVGRMLELDPAKRCTLDEITSDSWISRTTFCKQEVGGQVIRAEGHTHVLEGGNPPASNAAAKQ